MLEELKKEINIDEICDHCLGRLFYLKFKGYPIEKIGACLRIAKNEKELEKLLKEEKVKPNDEINCMICKNIFNENKKYEKELLEKAAEQEFNTFLIGCHVPEEILSAEEKLWEKTGIEYCIPIKKEIDMRFGKFLAKKLGKKVSIENPDVLFIIDYTKGKISKKINPLFIKGRYRKLVRGIPQTKWPCRNCHGKGCEKCNFTGKQYQESVEELIAAKLIEMTKAIGSKFHGEGREDIDALMLGSGRPFIIELIEPKIRNIDLKKAEEKINSYAKGKIEVSDLEFSNKKEVRILKSTDRTKTYECIIECDEKVTEEKLRTLEKQFDNKIISQRTPKRVAHRRADKIRKKKIFSVKTEKLTDNKFKAIIKTQSGTYVKELISGDDGRTKPSFSDFIKNCKCVELNVIKVGDE